MTSPNILQIFLLLKVYHLRCENLNFTSKLPMLRESPYDHEVTRKMKRAATEIDKFRYLLLLDYIIKIKH